MMVKYNKIMLFRVEYHKAEFLAPLNIKNSYVQYTDTTMIVTVSILSSMKPQYVIISYIIKLSK